jgi:hypothetical protein
VAPGDRSSRTPVGGARRGLVGVIRCSHKRPRTGNMGARGTSIAGPASDNSMKLWSCVVVLLLLASACSSSRSRSTPSPAASTTIATAESAQQRADDACRRAAPDTFFNAQPTTVGDIHAIPGPVRKGSHAYSNVLPNLPARDFAAWCWKQPRADTYVSYLVGPNGEVVDNLGGSKVTNDPPAPGPMPLT